jgi:hypothetical protein
MFLMFIFHHLVKVMFVRSNVVFRVSGATFPHSLEESSKPAATAVGGPFPNTPAVKAVVAGIGFLFVAMSTGLFLQFADMTEAQASPAMRVTALRLVEEPLPAAPTGAIIVARPLALH